MIIYAPHEYPAPQHYHQLDYTFDEPLSVSVRYHNIDGGNDIFQHVDQITDPILRYHDDGALLLDVWNNDNDRDWVASTIFFIDGNHLALREARTFGRWRDKGLVHLMTVVAQTLTGWTKQTSGHRWVDVW